MTVTFELDLDRAKMNRLAKYLGHRSYSLKVIIGRHTHALRTDCSTWTTKLVGEHFRCSVVMQGEHLKRGSRLMDFDIRLGDAKCVPVSLTDSQVRCRPPQKKPRANEDIDHTPCRDDTLSISVCILLFTTKLFYRS